jgi:phosphohistidine phosphatase SixA
MKHNPLPLRLILMPGVILLIACAGTFSDQPRLPLLEDLGGTVVYFRHAATDNASESADKIDMADCSTQRNLSDAGRTQAQALGEWIAAQPFNIEQVLASPFCRCVDTATIAFSRVKPEDRLATFHWSDSVTRELRMSWFRETLARPISPANIRVLVGHSDFITELGLRKPAEAAGVIFQPTPGGGFKTVGYIHSRPYRISNKPGR